MYQYLKKSFLQKRKNKILKKGGRNNAGKITARHRGGGHKRLFYNLHWTNNLSNSLLVGNIVHKSYNKPLDIYFNKENNKLFLYSNVIENNLFENLFDNKKKGKFKLLKDISTGSYIYNIEQIFKKGPVFCRSKFSFGQVIQVLNDKVLIKLPSKKKKLFEGNLKITLLDNINLIKQKQEEYQIKKKAGVSRWLGKRPKVRGVAMNPIDHPHGGGEGKTSGGRASCSPTGVLSKGYKTKRKKHAKV